MEKRCRNFRLEILETGSGNTGSTGGVNPLQVLPECSGRSKNQPCDCSGSPLSAGASGALHSTRIFAAPAPVFFETRTKLFLVLQTFFYLRKKPNEF
jgi:hypothetical protein